MMADCSHCGAPQKEAGAHFCDRCGFSLHAEGVVCSTCRTLNEAGARFCKNCGAPQPSDPTDAAKKTKAFAGLYGFVREHVSIANGLIAFAGTSVSILDFLSPRLAILPAVIYAGTTLLVCLLVAAALFPSFDAWIVRRLLRSPQPARRIWRRGGWQFTVLLLTLVSGFGYASLAKASQGGLLASSFPEVRLLQRQLLELNKAIGTVQVGLHQANKRLKILVAAQQGPAYKLKLRGYKLDSTGLSQAIDAGDAKSVALFADLDMKISGSEPMQALLGLQGSTWNKGLAEMLKPSMFASLASCQTPGFDATRIKDLDSRCEAFVRLCSPVLYQYSETRQSSAMADFKKLQEQLDTADVSTSERLEMKRQLRSLSDAMSGPDGLKRSLKKMCMSGFR